MYLRCGRKCKALCETFLNSRKLFNAKGGKKDNNMHEDSGLLGPYVVLSGEQLPTFRMQQDPS